MLKGNEWPSTSLTKIQNIYGLKPFLGYQKPLNGKTK